jgi:hypothetical protein
MVCAGWEVAKWSHASCASTHLRPGEQRTPHSRKKENKAENKKEKHAIGSANQGEME